MPKRSPHVLTRAARRGALALLAALSFAHARAPRAHAQQKEAPASVSGRVREGERGVVITGRVPDGEGNPVIAEPVTVEPADDKTPQLPRGPFDGRDRMTDDRGVYRIYGLAPGRYRVSVGIGGEMGAVS